MLVLEALAQAYIELGFQFSVALIMSPCQGLEAWVISFLCSKDLN